MASSYSNAHRLFLQASMSERFFPETKAIEMYRKACVANNGKKNFFRKKENLSQNQS